MNQVAITSQLNRLDLDRLKGYRGLLDFYHGRQWEGRERRGEKRLTFNYTKVFIDKLTSYLMSGINFVVEAAGDSVEDKAKARLAEAALRQVYEENNLEQLDLETEIDCAILGDAVYKVIWDSQSRKVRITAPDVQGIYAWWLGDDSSRLWRVASRYRLTAEEIELLYGLKPKGKQATIVELWTDAEFELYLDDALIEKKPNPYGFIPFVIYPNLREPKRFWGISDLAQIMESQRELNRAMSQLSRILELSGNPIAVLENVEESEDIAIRPGAVWNIPEDAKAYLLDLLQGGGVGLHIDYINLLYRTMHDIAESPRAAFGGTERDLSGVALEIELNPLLQKVRRKRIIRTAAYNRRNRLILKLLEKYQGTDFGPNRLQVIWSPILPQDLSRLVANEQTLVQSGIHSRRRAMDEIGVKDAEDEFQRWLEEREAILKMNKRLNANWRARHQFRWNKQSDEMNVKEILAFILARVGLKLEVKSASSALTDSYPDFTISPDSGGDGVIQRLLSFLPDVFFTEGDTVYVVNPQADDDSDYSYGSAHAIFEGSYRAEAWGVNRLQIEGYDPTAEETIVVDAFAWEEVERLYDRLARVEDQNIESVAAAGERGEAHIRKMEMAATSGTILIPPNCGQQLYDVVDITDSRAGLSAAKRRVNGLTLVYNPRRGEYRQRLLVSGV